MVMVGVWYPKPTVWALDLKEMRLVATGLAMIYNRAKRYLPSPRSIA